MPRFITEYGFYEFNPFPGCNQIVVSNHSFVDPSFRGKGHGTSVARKRLAHANSLGYDLVLATVQAQNTPQIKIMEHLRWKPLVSFVSRVSEKEVILFSNDLKPENYK
jgi:RimJ/RimL family protein N-acetyltransferase